MTMNREKGTSKAAYSGLIRMLRIGSIVMAFMFLYPMTSFAQPTGLLEENRNKLDLFIEALWLGEWDYENKDKIEISSDTLTPGRLREYAAPLAKHHGWGRMLGGSYVQIWRTADLKELFMEALDVTEEQASAAYRNYDRGSMQWTKEYYDVSLEEDEWLIGEGDWGQWQVAS